MIGRDDIRAVIEESQELHEGDDAAALRSLGINPRAVEDEARYIASVLAQRRVPYVAAVAAGFHSGLEVGFRLAQRRGRESS
jgi:hypothetical protein